MSLSALCVAFAAWNLATSLSFGQMGVLHVVVASDELDENAGSYFKQDRINVLNEFKLQVPKERLNICYVKPSNMKQENITNVIRNPKGKRIGPDDALVFIYSGHGGWDEKLGHYLWLSQPKKAFIRDVLRSEVNQSGDTAARDSDELLQ